MQPDLTDTDRNDQGRGSGAKLGGLLQRIQADLLLDEFKPGEWLRLVDMEERYQVSRFEIRAGLASLAAMELLEHVPNRGYRVVSVTEEEARQRTEVRILLELPAAEMVLRLASAEDCRKLYRMADHFAWCVENGTTAAIEAANHRFHRAFFALCGNPRLERLINETRERAWPSGWVHWKTVSSNRESAADHTAMVDAIAAGDSARLRGLAFRHLHRIGSPPRDDFAELLGIPADQARLDRPL